MYKLLIITTSKQSGHTTQIVVEFTYRQDMKTSIKNIQQFGETDYTFTHCIEL